MTIEKIIDDVFNDPTASDWLKSALRSALSRDVLDAANDAEMLFLILSQRLGELFAANGLGDAVNKPCVLL
jgi:hypothetical protein